MAFKECSMCGQTWHTRDLFLSDPTVVLAGYQANFIDLEAGLFLFNHLIPGCNTTLAVESRQFTDLHQGPIFEERMTGKPGCPGHCLHTESLAPCVNKCECAYVRDVVQIVKKWPKNVIKKAS